MRPGKLLSSGDLELIILALLEEKPRHGYEIMKTLSESSSGVYSPSPGMVYPSLTYLEEMAYAISSIDGAKKLYTITDAGREYLAKEKERADQALANLQAFGRRFSEMQRQFAEDEDAAQEFGHDRSAGSRERWEMKAEFRELRMQLKEALFEKMQASLEEKKRVLTILREAIAKIRAG
jgi:DNA-binding PadR family transcriptional regulator